MRFDPLAKKNKGASRLCDWTQERMFAYVDGSMDAKERVSVQLHLDGCLNCQQELALVRRSEEALASAPFAIPAPGDLRAGFYAKLAEAETARAPRPYRGQWGVALSACFVLLFAVVVWRVLPTSPSGQPVQPQPSDSSHTLAMRDHQENEEAVLDIPTAGPVDKRAEPLTDATDALRAKPVNSPRVASAATTESRVYSKKKTTFDTEDSVMGAMAAEVKATLKKSSRLQEENRVASTTDRLGLSSAADKLARSHARNRGLDRLETKQKDAREEEADTATFLAMKPWTDREFYELRAFDRDAKAGDGVDYAERASGYVVASNVPEEGDIKLEVSDDVRGFRATARYANRVEVRDDGEVLTIEANETVDDGESE